MEKKFKQYAQEDIERGKEIEKNLVKFVKEHGNFIDMRNEDGKHDDCYGIFFYDDTERYEGTHIVALTTFEDNTLGVLVEFENDSFEDLSKEEMLDGDNWFTIYGGYLWINATLIAICECVEQYV